ncbi:hypothetical protein DVA86_18670 [Streptomyces armeniacus]|uniref:asparagine synthase (glutamine-hydrolyzing) n=1 Tax=Streptomyces armeniacus TaxID=83291 RepID=A0A345XRV4_9ACTN|nr:asparagine synthase-related protein [Streptomyces armeniacus]AXK34370.1 hypothetical protein DVA86_18670 [Streptomyces armeniacus]
MPLTAFGMSGSISLAGADGRESDYRFSGTYGTDPRRDHDSAGIVLMQGPVHDADVTGVQPDPSPPDTAAPPRVALTGWAAVPRDHSGPPDQPFAALQRALDERGPESLRAVPGDYVAAHVAADRRRVVLCRPANAVTPLFWRADGDRLRWSTDPVDLLPAAGPTLGDVDVDALPFIIAGVGMAGDRSWFRGVHRLAPGHLLEVSPGAGRRPVVRRYDQVAATDVPSDLDTAAEALRERLATACSRLVAGERTAMLLLSGGLDSAVVAHETADLSVRVTGMHFTLDGFPGFAEDVAAAKSVAEAGNVRYLPFDMTEHARRGGGYLDAADSTGFPVTQVPLPGLPAAAEHAEGIGARMLLSGLYADQVFSADHSTAVFAARGLGALNPTVAGEPVWQLLSRAAGASFGGGEKRRFAVLRYLAGRASGRGDALLSTFGELPPAPWLSADAADAFQRAARDNAERSLAAVRGDDGRRDFLARYSLQESLNAVTTQAGWINHCMPRRCMLTTPFLDRDVIEFVLSLPSRHRTGVAYGRRLDKLVLRLAYGRRAGLLDTGLRMHQARIDAVPAVYTHQNFERIRELLSPDALLCRLGIVDKTYPERLNRTTAHRDGEHFVRLAVIEKWLRRLPE